MSGIEVHIRVRPIDAASIWSTADSVLFVTNRPDQRHVFSKVHGPLATNSTLFQSIEPLVHAAIEGRNVTIMAYGQTGSGKTHSMVGSGAASSASGDLAGQSDPGFIDRAASLLLALSHHQGVDVAASCIEIYNEAVHDLLSSSADYRSNEVALRELPDGSVAVDRSTYVVTSMKDFASVQRKAETARRYGVTDLNEHSSRSHFILTFDMVHRASGQRSSMCFVDLAGSESAARAHTEGQQLREGGFINRSLLALGNVVDAIVDGRSHIPYRESKLTRVLRGCLGGRSLTFILCCVNPAAPNYDQTTAALRFAQRAMKIQNDPTLTLAMPPFAALTAAHCVSRMCRDVPAVTNASYEAGLATGYAYCVDGMRHLLGELASENTLAVEEARRYNISVLATLRDRALNAVDDVHASVGGTARLEQLAERRRQLAEVVARKQSDVTAAAQLNADAHAATSYTQQQCDKALAAARHRLAAQAQSSLTPTDHLVLLSQQQYESIVTETATGWQTILLRWAETFPCDRTARIAEAPGGAAPLCHKVFKEALKRMKDDLARAKEENANLDAALTLLQSTMAQKSGSRERSIDVAEATDHQEVLQERATALASECAALDVAVEAPFTHSFAEPQMPRYETSCLSFAGSASSLAETADMRQGNLEMAPGTLGHPSRSTLDSLKDIQQRFLGATTSSWEKTVPTTVLSRTGRPAVGGQRGAAAGGAHIAGHSVSSLPAVSPSLFSPPSKMGGRLPGASRSVAANPVTSPGTPPQQRPTPTSGGARIVASRSRMLPPPPASPVQCRRPVGPTSSPDAAAAGLGTPSGIGCHASAPPSPMLFSPGTPTGNVATHRTAAVRRPRTAASIPSPSAEIENVPSTAAKATRRAGRQPAAKRCERSPAPSPLQERGPGTANNNALTDGIVGIAARRRLEGAEIRPAAQRALFF